MLSLVIHARYEGGNIPENNTLPALIECENSTPIVANTTPGDRGEEVKNVYRQTSRQTEGRRTKIGQKSSLELTEHTALVS